MNTIQQKKAKLRTFLRAKSNQQENDRFFLSLEPFFQSVQTQNKIIAGFFAMRHEPDMSLWFDKYQENGLITAMPRLCPDDQSKKMVFIQWRQGDKIEETKKYKLRQPVFDKKRIVIPDIIFVPGLGFDIKGNRIGRGGGYYDRAIAEIKKQKKVQLVGVSLEAHLVKKIDTEPHDQKMDLVLTEKRLVKTSC